MTLMVTILYYALIAYVTALIIWNLVKSRKWQDELLYIIILMPFLLRLLRLK
jgi:ABC-type spermidine/putrescine transport system permease subunit I